MRGLYGLGVLVYCMTFVMTKGPHSSSSNRLGSFCGILPTEEKRVRRSGDMGAMVIHSFSIGWGVDCGQLGGGPMRPGLTGVRWRGLIASARLVEGIGACLGEVLRGCPLGVSDTSTCLGRPGLGVWRHASAWPRIKSTDGVPGEGGGFSRRPNPHLEVR